MLISHNKRQSCSKSEVVNTSAEMKLCFQLSSNIFLVMTVVTSVIRTSKGKMYFIILYSLIRYDSLIILSKTFSYFLRELQAIAAKEFKSDNIETNSFS